jgi:hypothetical protein
VNTLPPLVTQATIRANLEKHAIRKNVKKGGGGLGETLSHFAGGIDRSIPLFNVPIEAGEELAESITGKKQDKSSFLHPGQEGAAAGKAAVDAIPVVGAASQVGETAGKTIAQHAEQIESGTEALGKLAINLNKTSTWVRVGKVIVGVLIIGLALWLVIRAISPAAASAPASVATRGAKLGVSKLKGKAPAAAPKAAPKAAAPAAAPKSAPGTGTAKGARVSIGPAK